MTKQALNQVVPEWFWKVIEVIYGSAIRHEITEEQLRWFVCGLNQEQRERLMGQVGNVAELQLPVPMVKCPFELFADLGEIVVPTDYCHETRLGDFFQKERQRGVRRTNGFINDKNFSNPSRILLPGEKLLVKAVRQNIPLVTTEQSLFFLAGQNVVYPGIQGLTLVFEQKFQSLRLGQSYYTLDQVDRFPSRDEYKSIPLWRYVDYNRNHFDTRRLDSPSCETEILIYFVEPAA